MHLAIQPASRVRHPIAPSPHLKISLRQPRQKSAAGKHLPPKKILVHTGKKVDASLLSADAAAQS